MLNKTRLSVLTLGILVAGTASAASDNTINFQGEVAAQTCQVTVNGNAANPTVLLPTVSTTDLTAAGATAGKTAFTIGVTGCEAPAEGAELKISTVFVGNNVDTDGNLSNVAGTATNVALQLLTPTSTVINLNTPSETKDKAISLDAAATSGSADYFVQYVSTAGSATAGSVVGSVQYALSYN
ncbi:fimbrial protein [Vibrio aphrogenes]|uniref:fimbrial protein n=1 Tax=Vibrio aphrogenes TaxID=1891186 RepID=UPI000B35B0A0|nr:fimbrial protein [Vibrio aphrogenes]